MKRVILVAVVLLSFVAAAPSMAAKDVYGTAGCGLGSMLFGDEEGFVQVFAATTNGTFGSQTFGISSGTSNCDKQPKFAGNKRLNEFVAANMDSLARDVASGGGESLDTVAELLNISKDQRPATYAKLKANYATIFPSENVQMADVVDNLIRTINKG